MSRISVIIITLNEERNITACLESVTWADEIIVLDSGSTDRTVELARRFTQSVHNVEWKGYGSTRNIGLDRATGEWVLWLDADERVPADLAEEIRAVVRQDNPACTGYDVARRAFFLGKWIRHCGWYPGRVVRLFRRGRARFNDSRVHEQIVVEGDIGRLHNDLLHYTDRDLEHYFRKFNRYTTLAAQDLHANGKTANVLDMVFRPPFMFFKMYVLRLGCLDGVHGFVLCVVSSAYVFAKYAKLWELSRPSLLKE